VAAVPVRPVYEEERVIADDAEVRDPRTDREAAVAEDQTEDDPGGRNRERNPPPVHDVWHPRDGQAETEKERRVVNPQGNSGQRYGEVHDCEGSGKEAETVPERAARLGAQPLPETGDDQRVRLADPGPRRPLRCEQGCVDDLVALPGAMLAGERAASQAQEPAHQLVAFATFVSTTRAARRRRPASAVSAACPSCVSV
jgi:hypothetical protein